MSVTDEQLDDAARKLIGSIDQLLDHELPTELVQSDEAERMIHWDNVRLESQHETLLLFAWQERSICRTHKGDWFTLPHRGVRKAKRVELALCEACPVRVECLDHALEMNEPAGIWGGLLPSER